MKRGGVDVPNPKLGPLKSMQAQRNSFLSKINSDLKAVALLIDFKMSSSGEAKSAVGLPPTGDINATKVIDAAVSLGMAMVKFRDASKTPEGDSKADEKVKNSDVSEDVEAESCCGEPEPVDCQDWC